MVQLGFAGRRVQSSFSNDLEDFAEVAGMFLSLIIEDQDVGNIKDASAVHVLSKGVCCISLEDSGAFASPKDITKYM